jgi:hypothetical protein
MTGDDEKKPVVHELLAHSFTVRREWHEMHELRRLDGFEVELLPDGGTALVKARWDKRVRSFVDSDGKRLDVAKFKQWRGV